MKKESSISTPDKIWSILEEVSVSQRELSDSQRELSDSQKETDEQIKRFSAEIAASQKELSDIQKETEKQIKTLTAKTDKQMEETDRRLRELNDLFTGQWGKLMETLVKGDLVKLLNTRGIEVNGLAKEHERLWKGKQYEYDIIAINGKEVVVVEVKTTLKLRDLEKFIKKLEVFKEVLPEYGDKTVYGAIAYLKANEGAERRSEKRGLFVIRATGSSASIINGEAFSPKVF